MATPGLNADASNASLEQASKLAMAQLQGVLEDPLVPSVVPLAPEAGERDSDIAARSRDRSFRWSNGPLEGSGSPTLSAPPGPLSFPGSDADKQDRLFVSKVPMSVTREDLRMHFSQFGDLTDVYLPAPPGLSGGHKGICFISFADPASLQRVLAAQPHEIRGERLGIDIAAPRALPPQTVTASVSNGTRLFLTKVTQDISRADLQSYFSQFGELADCYVPPGNKGIAFVSYKDAQNAQRVLQSSSHQVKPGSVIVVAPAFDRPPPGAPPGSFGGKGKGFGGGCSFSGASGGGGPHFGSPHGGACGGYACGAGLVAGALPGVAVAAQEQQPTGASAGNYGKGEQPDALQGGCQCQAVSAKAAASEGLAMSATDGQVSQAPPAMPVQPNLALAGPPMAAATALQPITAPPGQPLAIPGPPGDVAASAAVPSTAMPGQAVAMAGQGTAMADLLALATPGQPAVGQPLFMASPYHAAQIQPMAGAGQPMAVISSPLQAIPGQPPASPGQAVAMAGQPLALQGQPVALPGQPVAMQGQPLLMASQPVALASELMAVLGQSQTLAIPGQPVAFGYPAMGYQAYGGAAVGIPALSQPIGYPALGGQLLGVPAWGGLPMDGFNIATAATASPAPPASPAPQPYDAIRPQTATSARSAPF